MIERPTDKVKYVQRIRRPDGTVDLYFRKGGHREGPLRSADGSPELQAEVNAILSRLARTQAAQTPKAGTVGGAIERYRKSADFIRLALSTQVEYGRLLKEIELDVGDVRLAEVDKSWVRDLRDLWAPRGHKATNDRVQMLKNVLKPAVEDDRIKTNPFLGLKKLAPPHDADEVNLAWTDEEVDAFIALALERNMPGLARAVALGRWGGFRRGTICNIPLSARIIAQDDDGLAQRRLYWTTEKRKVLCDKREDSRLSAFLESTPAKALTIAYNQRGHPWKVRALNQAVTRLAIALAETKRARPNLTPHGLRHARGLELAYAGASDAEIMAQLEHTTERAARIYRRQAERRRMADSGQDRVDNVVALKAERKRSSNGA
ncbi:integrase [Brevundimonas vesicularis]|uniref:site-specific integrase n=1 Tax=Brevundimonas vesicularis TaxID=41276 RepID=UPI0027895FBC|nr:site-specific integrase [Brevundimonas vesicularis]MDQ1191303.1 integrase [Brevundimonas vesicularis]